MLSQALDFRDECQALDRLLTERAREWWRRPTQFREWTFSDILAHLHLFDHAASLALLEPEAFARFAAELLGALSRGQSLRDIAQQWLAGTDGEALLERWRQGYRTLASHFAEVDPARRIAWIGPDMSARSCMSARQMETWAHAQAMYDSLGIERQEHDRIRNIAIMGINTFAWTFANRGLEVPAARPFVRLIAPSGASWQWHDPGSDERIEGSAVEFCRVVAQTRNVADTELKIAGATAQAWMSNAQCFAGPPQRPPPPGTRFRARPKPTLN